MSAKTEDTPETTTMLYRPGKDVNPECWNAKVEHKVFADEDVAAALKDGWFKHPDDFPKAKAEAKA